MKKQITTLLIAIITFSSVSLAKEPNAFLGDWSIDFDRTMKAAAGSPKYDEKDAEKMPSIIEKMVEMMKIRITPDQFIYVRDKKEMAFSYTLTESTENRAVILVPVKEQEVTITFTLIDEKFMNYKSSGTNDMDYFIWKKVVPEEKE